MTQPAIVIEPRDNVATLLRLLTPGECIELEVGGRPETVQALQAIPFGHKIALARLEQGEAVLKYGEVIGLATRAIEKGEHVHTHNVVGPEAGAGSR